MFSKKIFGHQTGRQGTDSGDTLRPKSYVLWLRFGPVWAPGAAEKSPKTAKNGPGKFRRNPLKTLRLHCFPGVEHLQHEGVLDIDGR